MTSKSERDAQQRAARDRWIEEQLAEAPPLPAAAVELIVGVRREQLRSLSAEVTQTQH